MAVITERFGAGGANITPGGASAVPNLATAMRDMADDFAAMRAAVVGITAKLDADAGVTDTDYASLHDPAALKTVKG